MKRDCERKADELGSDSTAAVMPIRLWKGIQREEKELRDGKDQEWKLIMFGSCEI